MRTPLATSMLLLLSTLPLFACGLEVEPEPLPALGDLEMFTRLAQPVLEARCANPACHGRPDRPLEIFAVQQHRLEESALFSSLPLSSEELWQNALRAAAFVGDLEDGGSSLLDKPLAESAGGLPHAGGDVLFDAFERDYTALFEWSQTCREEEAAR